ncbi:MAG: cytochrome c3 family protein [Desulfobacteraceae bacterium]|nr:cytochrome c3 family protein [Desulfobacteraceae bacterium]
MRVKIFIMVVLTAAFLIIGIAVASENQGAENMDLDAGKKGTVDFPHLSHQTAIGDCNVCHSSFPKTSGAIKDLIEQKKFKKKQVMNKTCLKCHKAKKKAGEKTGPTKCSACHVK